MTPEENRLLTDLASKISQTPAPPRDPEAEEFIRKNIGNRPDALYLMTQTVLIQNMAIQQAQQQIRDLQQRQAAGAGAASGSSFLGSPPPQYTQSQYASPQPQYSSPSSPSYGQSGGGPGFLRGAAQTAAGVAAGALAFEGIRSLFEHPGFGSGGFAQAGFMGGGMPGSETIVNNYYDSPGNEAGGGGDRLADTADPHDYQNDDAQVQDADYLDSNADDSSNFDS